MEDPSNQFIVFVSLIFGAAVFVLFTGLTAVRGLLNLWHSFLVSIILTAICFVFLKLKGMPFG